MRESVERERDSWADNNDTETMADVEASLQARLTPALGDSSTTAPETPQAAWVRVGSFECGQLRVCTGVPYS